MCMVIFYISHVHFFWIFFFFFITTYRYVCAKQFTELRTGLWWETDKTSAWFVCVWRSATSPDERLKMVGIRGVHTHTQTETLYSFHSHFQFAQMCLISFLQRAPRRSLVIGSSVCTWCCSHRVIWSEWHVAGAVFGVSVRNRKQATKYMDFDIGIFETSVS